MHRIWLFGRIKCVARGMENVVVRLIILFFVETRYLASIVSMHGQLFCRDAILRVYYFHAWANFFCRDAILRVLICLQDARYRVSTVFERREVSRLYMLILQRREVSRRYKLFAQRFILFSITSNGILPSLRISSWKSESLNFGPNSLLKRSRISRIFKAPILYESACAGIAI